MSVQILRNTDPTFHLPSEGLGFALEQRSFGPRRTVVLFADTTGTVTTLAHTLRSDPVLPSALCCLDHADESDVLAVVYSDEPVAWGEPGPELVERFEAARWAFDEAGVRLVDWILCDDLLYRSLRLSIGGDDDWWPAA